MIISFSVAARNSSYLKTPQKITLIEEPHSSCGDASIPMEKKHIYSRSLTPEQAPGNALAVGFSRSHFKSYFLGKMPQNHQGAFFPNNINDQVFL
jgi:hypothetical protein